MFAKSTQVGSIYFKIQLSLLKPFSTEKWFAYREENNQKMIENKVELFWVKNSTEYIWMEVAENASWGRAEV